MTDQNLPELLEHAANRTPVGPAPTAGVVAAATRVRRRRAAFAVIGASALAAVIGAVTVVAVPDGEPDPQPLVASPDSDQAPQGMRLVGLGHAAVAVPQTWSTNAEHCSVPTEDTALVDLDVVHSCLQPWATSVDSVHVNQGEPVEWTVDDDIRIGDVPAQRQHTTCRSDRGVTVCSGAVYIPSMDVSFRVQSSTSSAVVDRVLDRIRIVPDLVGVPGVRELRKVEQVVDALRDLGLVAEVRTEPTSGSPGNVLGTRPGPGTMLHPGDVVTVVVAKGADGSAD